MICESAHSKNDVMALEHCIASLPLGSFFSSLSLAINGASRNSGSASEASPSLCSEARLYFNLIGIAINTHWEPCLQSLSQTLYSSSRQPNSSIDRWCMLQQEEAAGQSRRIIAYLPTPACTVVSIGESTTQDCPRKPIRIAVSEDHVQHIFVPDEGGATVGSSLILYENHAKA